MKKLLVLTLFLGLIYDASAQNVKYTSGENSWNPDSLGNHRAVVSFYGIGEVARVVIPWRRRDADPQKKRIIVQDATTGNSVSNCKAGKINNEEGEIFFEPVSGKGDYFIYYMPYKNEGRSNYPKGVYLEPIQTAKPDWLAEIQEGLGQNCVLKEIQSIDTFNSFFPMEVIATKKETDALIAAAGKKAFIVFPEDRMFPIKMNDHLPQRWVQKGASNRFSGQAAPGENYAWQFGVFALRDLKNVQVRFSDLKKSGGGTIKASAITCINTTGTRYDGSPFVGCVNVAAQSVQALWCTADIPMEAQGVYTGTATITADGVAPVPITVSLKISGAPLQDKGISEPWKQTRLTWINSTIAQENTVLPPYTPLQLQHKTISLLGRKVELNDDGLPKQIQTYFSPEMTEMQDAPNTLLTEPIHFHFYGKDGKKINLVANGLRFTERSEGTIAWEARSVGDGILMLVNASLEFDGFAAFTVKVIADRDIELKEINMHIPFNKTVAEYAMGLGLKGGYRPEKIDWKWDVANKNQDGAWIGTVNAGLQYSLRDENYSRPLNTNFYLQKPLVLPTSWGNENKGGITIEEKGTSILANNYSGERKMKKGDTLYYNFNLLITPFHPIDTEFQWASRFYHRYQHLDTIVQSGATIVNIHHANEINPWINYPFIEHGKMKAYIDEAHSKGLKVKIYNTVRELSNRAYETFPLRSLGHEIYSSGKGAGFSWLQEHVGKDYIAAWFVPGIKDAAIVNSGMSRWHNYYVEGMNWLVKNIGIDGIYLDDVAFDRITMKRIKRVMTADGHPGIIDLHSANQFNKSDGFINSANLYMEHFPYINRLWFGEYFDYEAATPDFYLTEVSGIPFGLMGEMLQDGGNPWRGMVYGMTNRIPWNHKVDLRDIWKVWDEFGIKGTKMLGYWSPNCPVRTTHDNVLATAYVKDGAAMISIASWAAEDTTVKLKIDWEKLGINPASARILAPAIPNFQPAAEYKPDSEIFVPKNKGWILYIRRV